MVSITAAAVFVTVGGLAAARGGRAEPTRPGASPAPRAQPPAKPLAANPANSRRQAR